MVIFWGGSTSRLALTEKPFSRSDNRTGRDEAGRGEARRGGQNQRSSAPRGLGAEAAEAAAGGMDIAGAPEANAESANGAGPRLRPSDWATRTPNQKKNWNRAQRKQRK